MFFRYNLVTSTPEEKKMFKVLPFNYVIFDEAHMLKNMNTQRFENLMRINVSLIKFEIFNCSSGF